MQLFVLHLEAAVPTVRCAQRHDNDRLCQSAAEADAKCNTGDFKDKSNALVDQEHTEPTYRNSVRSHSSLMNNYDWRVLGCCPL